jgi:hypothetical protein
VDSVVAIVRLGGEGTKLHHVRSLTFSGLARLCAAAFCLSVPGVAALGTSAHAADTLEERKLPMAFTWYDARSSACESDCGNWIGAVGVITADTPANFDAFVKDRNLGGVTMVLDSSGGSVLDAIALGRRWRDLGLKTAVGMVIERAPVGGGVERDILPNAYCESMCVFLLLSGQTRTIPAGAHVRVHQIWMGDRAEDAKAANYSAQDMMIVERDIGRLAKYTFEMGGSGDLLSLALSVPPWESLHELTAAELRLTNLITGEAVAEVSAPKTQGVAAKPVQDRFINADAARDKSAPLKSTQTALAEPPTGGAAAVVPDRK